MRGVIPMRDLRAVVRSPERLLYAERTHPQYVEHHGGYLVLDPHPDRPGRWRRYWERHALPGPRELLGDLLDGLLASLRPVGEFVVGIVFAPLVIIWWLLPPAAMSIALYGALSYALMLALWAFGTGELHWLPEYWVVPSGCDQRFPTSC